jgi:hypothetical protein
MAVTISIQCTDPKDPNYGGTGEWQVHSSGNHKFRVWFSPSACFVTAQVFTANGFGPPMSASSTVPGQIDYFVTGLMDGTVCSIVASAYDFGDVASDTVRRTIARRPMIPPPPPPAPGEYPQAMMPVYMGQREMPEKAEKKKKDKKKNKKKKK